jgi:hypothetical protein
MVERNKERSREETLGGENPTFKVPGNACSSF